MPKINLLPPDLGPNASVLKFLNAAKKIAFVIGLLFFVAGVILIAYIVILQMEIKSIEKRSDVLKNSITAYQSTEQTLYLLKERAEKISKLFTKETKEEPLIAGENLFITNYGINFSDATASLGKISVSGSAASTQTLNYFFENIFLDDTYKSIKLTSFSYNPKTGYLFSLDLNLK